jgi:hypothetical protein
MKWDIYDAIAYRGYPSQEELEKGEEQAFKLAKDVKDIESKTEGEDY